MSNDLTTGSIQKKLMRFFFPVLLGMLFQQLYSTVDAAIVGKFLGAGALAAVGGGSAVITSTVIGFFTGLSSGATVVISQRFGAGDGEGLSKVLHTFITFILIIGVFITAVLIAFAPECLRLIDTPEDIMEQSVTYLRVYFAGSIPLLMYNLFQGTLQAVGDSKRPLKYLVISCVMNIILDIVFVAVLKMGVAGAALASVISMVACMLLAFVYLLRVDGMHRIDLRKLCLDGGALGQTLRIGLPSGLNGCMYNVSNLIIQASVNGFGTSIAAAWTATSKLDGFYWVTINALGITICAFVGQCYGAGNLERLKQAIRNCMKIAIIITVVMSGALIALAHPAYSLFLEDSFVVDSACSIMNCFVPYYFLWSVIEILSGAFRGVGDTFRPMIITMLGVCLLRVVWIYAVVPLNNTIYMIGYAYPVTWLITGVALIIYYLRNDRLRGHGSPAGEQ